MTSKPGPGPGYGQVADILRQRITSGQYPAGSRIPSTRELESEFGCSATTVQRAIRVLKLEALVEGTAGVGVFVRSHRPMLHVSESYLSAGARGSWASEAERLGMVGTQELTHVGTVIAPEVVADRLGVEPGTTVVVRRRVMSLDGEPVQLADSYYPASVANGTALTEPRKLPGGTIAELERQGFRLRDFEEHISARIPSPEERRALRLGEGTPILDMIRTTYTEDGTPVEVDHSVLAADRHTLGYRLSASR